MKDWFWRTVAVVGLVVAAAYVFGVCRPFAPTPVGAQGSSLIAVTPGNQNSYALYIIDVSKRVLLVYDSRGGTRLTSFDLMYGRNIEPDAVLAQQILSMRWKAYSSAQVRKLLKGIPH